MGIFAYLEGAKGGNRINIKFGVGVWVNDVITHANLRDDRFGGFESRGRISHFSIDCVVVLKTLWHYSASV